MTEIISQEHVSCQSDLAEHLSGIWLKDHPIKRSCSDKHIDHGLIFLVLSHANMSVNH